MKANELKQKVDHYVNLPYTIAVERRDDQGTYYVARYFELPHLIMTGDTPEEAVRDLEAEKREWFEFNIEQGNKIPLPLKSRKYSGKIILRMSPNLHEHLIRLAELQGTSLNNFMVKAVAQAAGYEEVPVTVCK
ncbi:MAG: toxin-antitoxin system HicB family antitoxin [Dehalococcoidales bacterium]|nr:toxin-antitoxin system HicB family antitoxin [Dehalococcoidales bacterium]